MLCKLRFTLIVPLAAGILMVAPAANAGESPWATTDKAKVRLLSAGPAAASGASILRGGVEIEIARGWHTYWRYPGDAGVPPRFDWSGSGNLAAVEVRYPAPMRIPESGGSKVIGYLDHVVFPLRIRIADPARPVRLRLRLDFAVCEKICIPAEARLALDVPAGGGGSLPALDAAEARVPKPAKLGDGEGLGVLSLRLERGKQPRALIEVAVPPGKSFDLFAEGPTEDWALPVPDKIEAAGGRARFAVPIDGAPPGEKPGAIPATIKLTLVAGSEAIEVEAPLD